MANVYRFLKDAFSGVESFAVYTQSGIEAGDQMQWDATARKATNNALASGSIFLGVCEDAQPVASLGTTASPLTGSRVRIKSQGIHFMKTTAGETYSHLDAVYQGADVQTVTKVSAGRLIGRVWLPDGTQVTGAAGTSVDVTVYGSMTNNSTVPSAADAAR
jgi:hypothetical protein